MKITLEIEKSDSGLWFITSPELKGFLIAEKTLDMALHGVVPAGREMWQAMEDIRNDGKMTPAGAEQQAAYTAFFGR
jgi:hypothetical protein